VSKSPQKRGNAKKQSHHRLHLRRVILHPPPLTQRDGRGVDSPEAFLLRMVMLAFTEQCKHKQNTVHAAATHPAFRNGIHCERKKCARNAKKSARK
jgi:hypothetical protein